MEFKFNVKVRVMVNERGSYNLMSYRDKENNYYDVKINLAHNQVAPLLEEGYYEFTIDSKNIGISESYTKNGRKYNDTLWLNTMPVIIKKDLKDNLAKEAQKLEKLSKIFG